MDEKDIQIINILRENARMPYAEIAKLLNVTEATVRKRVKNLEKNGVIKKYTIEVDPAKLGYSTITILGLDVEPQYLLEAAHKIAELDEVKKVATSSGDHMIMAEIWTKNTSELFEVISKKIAKIKGVKKLCPAILLEEIK